MKYNTLSDHENVFEVPSLYTDGKPLYVGMTLAGYDRDDLGTRARWAYTIATGPFDADVQYQGEDLHGPVIGPDPEPHEMVATLLGFLGAYGSDGELRHVGYVTHLFFDGDLIAINETAEFISEHGEEFGIAAMELEEAYLAYTDRYWNESLGLYVGRAFPTGKEPE